mgnify:FL=1
MQKETTLANDVPLHAHLTKCPHCNRELRVAPRFLDQEVSCRFCSGRLRICHPEGEHTANQSYRVFTIPITRSQTTEGSIPHWPATMEATLNGMAGQGYQFLRSFPVGEHLAVILHRMPHSPDTS